MKKSMFYSIFSTYFIINAASAGNIKLEIDASEVPHTINRSYNIMIVDKISDTDEVKLAKQITTGEKLSADVELNPSIIKTNMVEMRIQNIENKAILPYSRAYFPLNNGTVEGKLVMKESLGGIYPLLITSKNSM